MPQITLSNLPSLHARDNHARALLRDEVAHQLAGQPMTRCLYETTIELWHEWLDAKGQPLTRNGDNLVKNILDAIQAATGINDAWLEGWGEGLRYVKRHTLDQPFAVVTLMPVTP